MNDISTFSSSLIDFERIVKEEAKQWTSEETRNNWISFTESAQTLSDVCLSFNIFISAQTIPRGEKVPNDTTIEDLARKLLTLEMCTPWSDVTDEFRDMRSNWQESLRTITNKPFNYPRQLPLDDFGKLKESILRLEEFMVEDGMIWSQKSRNIWVNCVTNSTCPKGLAPLLVEFRKQVNPNYGGGLNVEFIENISLVSLANYIRSIETSISWSGVIDEFQEERNLWVNTLCSIVDIEEEEQVIEKKNCVNVVNDLNQSCALHLDENTHTITLNIKQQQQPQEFVQAYFNANTTVKLFFILLLLLIFKL